MSIQTSDVLVAEHVPTEELQRILVLQRAAFLGQGPPSAEVRRNRIDRLMLAILEAADDIAVALERDYGGRPPALSKMFDVLSWLEDAKVNRENLEEWMKPVHIEGPPPAFIEQKPKGVVGVMGAWNFPISLTVHPAFAALAAGNRVMMKFPEFHPRAGEVLAEAVARYFPEDEVAVVLGDLETARSCSSLGDLFNGLVPALKTAGLLDRVKILRTSAQAPQLQSLVDGTTHAWTSVPITVVGTRSTTRPGTRSGSRKPGTSWPRSETVRSGFISSADVAQEVLSGPDEGLWSGPEGYEDQFRKLWGVSKP